MDGESTIPPLNLFQDSSNNNKKKGFWCHFIHPERICCIPVPSATRQILVVFTPSQQEFPHPLEFPPPTLSFLSHQRCSSSSSARLSAVNPDFFLILPQNWTLHSKCGLSSEEQVDFQKIYLILITNCGKYLP